MKHSIKEFAGRKEVCRKILCDLLIVKNGTQNSDGSTDNENKFIVHDTMIKTNNKL